MCPGHQHSGQHQGHFGVICRLPGNRIPGATVGELTNTIRVFPPDVCRFLELHQATKGIPGKLAQKVALCSRKDISIDGFALCESSLA